MISLKLNQTNKLRIATQYVRVLTLSARMREKQKFGQYVKATSIQVYLKQAEAFEKSLLGKLTPLFTAQIQSAIKKLKALPESVVNLSASNLVEKIFTPSDWDQDLVNRALPPIAVAMSESAIATFVQFQRDYHKWPGKRSKGTKASTATEWIESLDDDSPELEDVVFITPYGSVSMRIATEFPLWMKTMIEDNLKETFSQDYWSEINETTAGDIETLLRDGIQNGHSIARMAEDMEEKYGSDLYPKSRGRLIARTESGSALNSTRSQTIDTLISDLGMQDVIKKVWLSVLGNTTRDTHANLDSVPAGSDGCWALGGIRCRWPGDVRLPAKQRCNCQCTIVTEFGLTNDIADDLISESELRQENEGKSLKNCGTGAGGFKPGNNCARHGSSGPSTTGRFLDESPETMSAAVSAHHAKELNDHFHKQDKQKYIGIYKRRMEAADETLTRTQSAVAGIGSRSTELRDKIEAIKSDMKQHVDSTPNFDPKSKQFIEKRIRLLETEKELVSVRQEETAAAWKVLRKHSTEAGDDWHPGAGPMASVSLTNRSVSENLNPHIDRVENHLSGVVSSLHKQQIEATHFQTIPDGQYQRAYFEGKHHGGTSETVFLSKSDAYNTVAHELGHSLEVNRRVHQVAYGFLANRVGSEQAKPMGKGYSETEAGFDDGFGKSMTSGRYVGKIYRNGDTEIVSMGLEKLMTDPVHFAKSDPEYFKLTVGILNGSLL